jgi:hypothetical protein
MKAGNVPPPDKAPWMGEPDVLGVLPNTWWDLMQPASKPAVWKGLGVLKEIRRRSRQFSPNTPPNVHPNVR